MVCFQFKIGHMHAKTKQAGKKNTMCIQSIGLVQVLGGNKTIYTSEKAKHMYILLFWNIYSDQKVKNKHLSFSLILPESEENERVRRIRYKPFILSG